MTCSFGHDIWPTRGLKVQRVGSSVDPVRLSLLPSIDPSDYRFAHTVRTRFSETDAMGIVHHAAYLLYLEEARVEFLRDAGHPYDQVRADGVNFAVLEALVSYRRSVGFDEEVAINVMVGELTGTTFQIGYLLQVARETRATAVTVHGAVDSSGKARRLPTWLADPEIAGP
jgi:acyl-CoA thioester hydrolase